MKILRKDAVKTYESLLEAATEVFADKGYSDATIAEICERANANVASVNYHFGNKETLYIKVWRNSFLESVKSHPPDGGVSDEAPPEARLRGRVRALLHRLADDKNKEFLIMHKELANPTGLLNDVMKEQLRPMGEKMEAIVRELLGTGVSDTQVHFCMISILSQCINPMLGRKARKGKGFFPKIDDIEAYADHVVKFSLAGIREIMRCEESQDTTKEL